MAQENDPRPLEHGNEQAPDVDRTDEDVIDTHDAEHLNDADYADDHARHAARDSEQSASHNDHAVSHTASEQQHQVQARAAERAEAVNEARRMSKEDRRKLTEEFPAAIHAHVEGKDKADHDEEDGVKDRGTIIGQDARWLAGWALRFIIMIAAGWILWQGFEIIWAGLLPVLLALIVCTVLWPPVSWLRDHKVPPALAVVLTIIGAVAAFVGIGAAIAPSIRKQIPELIDRAQEGTRKLIDWIQGPPLNLELGELEDALNDLVSFLQGRSGQIASGVFAGLSGATSAAVTAFVLIVLVFFFLKDGPKFLPWMRRYTGGNAGWHLTEVLSRSWNTLAGFIRAQALVSFVDAFFIGLGLVILNVPLALALALITFFAGFIPIIGAISAGALAVIIALVTNGFTNAVLVLVLIVAVQQLEGNVLSPIIQSKAMNLHAVVVLLSVTLGSTLFGIMGAFLAVPVAAVVAVWFRYHSEMVALRAGEITIDDIHIATARDKTLTAAEGFNKVRDHLRTITSRKPAQPTQHSKD